VSIFIIRPVEKVGRGSELMEKITEEQIAFVDLELKELVENRALDEKMEKIIRHRYGIGCEAVDFRKMVKIFKMQPKIMKQEILKAERRVFNIIKKKML